MKTLNIAEVARDFNAVMDRVETDHEEIVLMRGKKVIARLIPEPEAQNASEVFSDLYRTLDEQAGSELKKAVIEARSIKTGTLKEMRNPWGS